MNPMWLVRMARWARHPPGPRQVMLVVGVIAACLLIAWAGQSSWWPDWATLRPTRHHGIGLR
ncbi:hypothetical protein [Acidimangrovimonas sediminis]|uniref:hypothetical protein n=1 Tax=Acidimangrovimonas sediminis TaxID=2056283 RepID=UPI000C803B40|nr:hypothetical protein [Acidimangrovimonas sediminis]